MALTISPEVVATRSVGMREAGWWLDRTIDSYLFDHARRQPDKMAVISHRVDGRPPKRLTYGQLDVLVGKAAATLQGMGVEPGDVVSVQLPNCWEFVVVALACSRVGAAIHPMVPILREREVRYMVGLAEGKVLVVPKTFRGFDHGQMAKDIQASLPTLKHIVLVDADDKHDKNGFESTLLGGASSFDFDPTRPRLDPDALFVLMYTSGTTGEPKGVMHTSNTAIGNVLRFGQGLGLTRDDVFFGATPVGHMTGFGIFVLLPLMLGATAVLQDVHKPEIGVGIMEEEGVTFTAGATPFLVDLCEASASPGPRPSRLRRFYCSGAPIPPALVKRAWSELNLTVSSVWGMTEIIAGTMTEPELAERAWTTDGRAIPGIDVKVVDDRGREVPRGEPGRLMVKSASMFCGYLKRPELYGVSDEGWLDTGDLARMDNEGYIRITGRLKELLIRGGENIPIIEVENVIMTHPSVASAAIVGFPDARLGERGCAFIVMRGGVEPLQLRDVQTFLEEQKVAKPFWPERVEALAELPKTASGKVQRFVLKELASKFAIH